MDPGTQNVIQDLQTYFRFVSIHQGSLPVNFRYFATLKLIGLHLT